MSLPPPHEDYLSGACLRLSGVTLLLAGDGWQSAAEEATLSSGESLLWGELALRYGLPYLCREDALIPRLVLDDFRREHSGSALFAFVAASGYAFPRADVIGVRASGGDDHVRLRELDLARPLVALAHSRTDPDRGSVHVALAVLLDEGAAGATWQAIAPGEEEGGLPALLVEHIPCFRLNPTRAPHLPALLGTRPAG